MKKLPLIVHRGKTLIFHSGNRPKDHSIKNCRREVLGGSHVLNYMGTVTRIVVPRSGRLWMLALPPACFARSRMLKSPTPSGRVV